MSFFEDVVACPTDKEAHDLVTKRIKELDENATKVDMLGMNFNAADNPAFKGFIPLNTKIKYSNMALETYKMKTTDYFYEFVDFLRENNFKNIFYVIVNIEGFLNSYFGTSKKATRTDIFNLRALQSTKTDEEFFAALENNEIGDLKGTGAAECTERSAMAQELLSLVGVPTYYCIGCVERNSAQEPHCFNVVKRKNDYAVVDYSLPVKSFNKEGELTNYYPFIDYVTNEEFEDFVKNKTLKTFNNYEYREGKIVKTEGERTYTVGQFSIEHNKQPNLEKEM